MQQRNWRVYSIMVMFVLLLTSLVIVFVGCNEGDGESKSAGNPVSPVTTVKPEDKTIVQNPSGCSCSDDLYNCENFSTQGDAQACFDNCYASVQDIHALDADKDMAACEEWWGDDYFPSDDPEPTNPPETNPTAVPTANPTAIPTTAAPTPTPVPTSVPTSSPYSCASKKTCTEMASCEEAYYHLNTCGNGSLDRNNDGVPCESICSGG